MRTLKNLILSRREFESVARGPGDGDRGCGELRDLNP